MTFFLISEGLACGRCCSVGHPSARSDHLLPPLVTCSCASAFSGAYESLKALSGGGKHIDKARLSSILELWYGVNLLIRWIA
jgi:hypothetical protein